MKILIFSLWLGIGGIETILLNLIENYPDPLATFCLYSGVVDSESKKNFEKAGVIVKERFMVEGETRKFLRRCEEKVDYVDAFFNIKNIVEIEQPDVLLLPNHFDFVPAIMVSALTGIPLVPVFHYAPHYICKNFKTNKNLKKVARADTAFLQKALEIIPSYYAVSGYAAHFLTEHLLGLPLSVSNKEKPPIQVLPNGVSLKQFAWSLDARNSLRSRYALPKDAVVIGSVGRIVLGQKRQDWVVEAVAYMHECGFKNTYGMLVGGGRAQEIEKITCYVEDCGVKDFIIFTGEHRDPAPYYSAFDIFANPSRAESFGLVTVEALACGLPTIITTPYEPCGTPDDGYGIIQDGYNGLVVHSDDKEAFIRGVKKLVEDKTLRERFALVARKSVEKFDTSLMAQRYYEIFTAAVQRPHIPQSQSVIKELFNLMPGGNSEKINDFLKG